jgi:hypothetical protein
MKCPYPNCRKDYNDTAWPKAMENWLTPQGTGGSIAERRSYNRLYIITRKCRFCDQLFHEVYVGHENFDGSLNTIEPLAVYPVSKTKFEAKNIPEKLIDAFNEAERCRSIGSLTGAGGCVRKTIYTVCDDKQAEGQDYRAKIENLGVKDTYKALLKQIKWLGDNTTKPGEEKVTV